MRKIWTFLLVVLTIVLLVFFGINLYITSDPIQAKIDQKIEAVLGREIEFAKLDLSLRGVGFHGLIVYDLKKEKLIKAKKLYLKLRLLELFEKNKKLEDLISYIRIKNAEYELSPDIKFSETDIFIRGLSEIKLSTKINSSEVKVVNTSPGKFTFNKENKDFTLDIDLFVECLETLSFLPNFKGEATTKVNLKMQNLDKIFLEGNFDFTKTEIIYKKMKKNSNVSCNLEYKLIYHKEPFSFNVDRAILNVNSEEFNISGIWKGKKSYDFNLGANGINISNLDVLFNSDMFKLKKGKIDLDVYFIRKRNIHKNSAIIVLDFLSFDVFSNKVTDLIGTISVSNTEFNVKRMTGLIDENRFEFSAFFPNSSSRKQGNYKLHLGLMDINKPLVYAFFFYPLNNENYLKSEVRGTLKFDKIIYKNLSSSDLTAKLVVQNKFIFFNDLKTNFKDGYLDGLVKLNILKDNKFYEADLSLTKVELDGISEVFGLKYNVTGKCNGNISIDGKIGKSKLKDFVVIGQLLAKDGEFQEITLFNKFAQKFTKEDTSILKYETTSLEVKLNEGVLGIKNFETKTKELGLVKLQGDINFISKELDIKLDFEVDKTISLIESLIIKGTFKKPKYQIVLTDVIKNLGEDILGIAPRLIKGIAKTGTDITKKGIKKVIPDKRGE